MDIQYWADILGIALIFLGACLTFVTALGIVRFNDLFSRMHAATKPQVLGLILATGGLALVQWKSSVTLTLLLVVAFQLITAPISAHMLGRAGYRSSRVSLEQLLVDEYTEDIVRVERELQQAAEADAVLEAIAESVEDLGESSLED